MEIEFSAETNLYFMCNLIKDLSLYCILYSVYKFQELFKLALQDYFQQNIMLGV